MILKMASSSGQVNIALIFESEKVSETSKSFNPVNVKSFVSIIMLLFILMIFCVSKTITSASDVQSNTLCKSFDKIFRIISSVSRHTCVFSSYISYMWSEDRRHFKLAE